MATIILPSYTVDRVVLAGSGISSVYMKFELKTNDAYYIDSDGKVKDGFQATASTFERILNNVPNDDDYVHTVNIVGTIDSTALSTITAAIKSNTTLSDINIDLSKATIASGLSTANAFKNCTKLNQVTFDVSTFPLSSTMFDGCSNLGRLYLYGNVTSWPSGIFTNCGRLNSIEFMDATSVMIPGTEVFVSSKYTSISSCVFEIPTTVRTITLEDIDEASLFQMMAGIRYYGTSTQLQAITIQKSSNNIETKAGFTCYGDGNGGTSIKWKSYSSGTAGGAFVSDYDTWSSATYSTSY